MNKAINGKRRALRLGTGIATCVSSIVLAQTAMGQSLPELSNAGGASISTDATTNTMTVDALAADRVINWGTFSVAQNNTVAFVSTDGAGGAVATPVTVINRVIGKDVSGTNTFFPSIIDGGLTATSNIAVWLINPSGVLFGPTGSFNGGSLVVSTLDFDSGTGSQVFGAGNRNSILQSRTVDIDPATALAAVELKLDPGAGSIVSSGSVLLLGEQVTVGKSLSAQGDVYIVAASDVRVTSQAGSPVNYLFNAGTRLNGARVLASGSVQGRNIVVAASNGTSTIANLLQVDAGGLLTATVDGGSVMLLTDASAAAAAASNIVSDGRLRTLGTSDNVTVQSSASVSVARIDATGNATVRSGAGATDTLTAGIVQADGDIDLRSTGDMTLGIGSADLIQAGGKVAIRSSGSITHDDATGTLGIRSHNDPAAIDGSLLVQAAGNALLGNASLTAGATGTAALTISAGTGAISMGSGVASRFVATAGTTFASTGSITADNSAVVGAGTALSIAAPGGITLNTARTLGTDQDISFATSGDFAASSVTASRNLAIGTSALPALSIDADSLTATNGTINAYAGSITAGTVSAGLSANLRSDGDVEVTTAGSSGNTQASGNFSVSGLTGTHAASFTGGVINALTGVVGIFANSQTVSAVRAASNATLNAVADVTLGSADVGGNLLVTTAGDITLGTLNAQNIVADGRVTITSTNGAIGRGAGSTALTIRSNDGDVTPADDVAIRGQNAVDLGNAGLFGGSNSSAGVSVESVSADVTIGSARGSSFTGKAATTFEASGAILAEGAAALAGNTISITGLTGLDLQLVRTGGTGENIVLTSDGPISATTLSAQKNLSVASLANPAASLSATTLTAQTGTISAFAQSMTLGSANAAQAMTLRSDGAISLTGSAVAGTNLSVSGLTGTRAASFVASAAQGTTGNVDIKAGTTDVTTTTAGQNVLVDGVDVTLGRVTAGTEPGNGSYTVMATGAVVLGKSTGQQQAARGGITITGASITQGATGLQLTSNNDDSGSGALALTATAGSLSLANATLKGGASQTSDISLISAGDTTINTALSANFASTSSGAFTASLVDAVGNAAITAGSVAATRVDATGDVTVRSDGAVEANTLAAGSNLLVRGNGSSHAASLAAIGGTNGSTISAATGAVTVRAGAINVASATSGAATLMDAQLGAGTIALGSVDAGTTAQIIAIGDITLGRAGNNTQTAAGSFTVTSTSGSISEGSGGVTITSNDDDGVGNEALQLSANGAIAMGNSTLRGGLTKTAPVTLTATNQGVAIKQALSADFTANASSAAAFTATLVDAAGNAAITAGSVAATAVKATGNITITGVNAVQSNTLAAGGNVTVKGSGTNYAASLSAIGGVNGTAITATTGAISVKAGAINIASATSGTSTTLDAETAGGTIAVDTVGAGTSYTANATGDITLGKSPGQTQAAAGAISITSSGGSIVRGAGATSFTLTANSDGAGGGDILLDAKGASGAITLDGATLNGGTAAQRTAVTLRSVTDTVLASVNSAAFTATARDFTSSGTIAASGDATITAVRAASINAIETTGTGSDIGITADSASINTARSAGDYTVSTSGAGGVTLGKSAGKTHIAAGAITITATGGGSISRGTDATSLTIAANSDAAGGGALTLTADGAISLATATLNAGTPPERTASTLTAGSDIVFANAEAAAFTATSTAGSFTSTGIVTASGPVSIAAGTAAAINQITTVGAGNGITVEATSASLGRVTSAGDYTVTTTTGDVTLGNGGGQTQSAAGAIKITSNEGAINEGAAGLTLLSNAAGTGTGTLELTSRTGIGMQGATLKGGADKQSDVILQTNGAIALAKVEAANFTSSSGGNIAVSGPVAAKGNVSISSSGNIALSDLAAEGSDHDVTLSALGTISADDISAARNVTVNGPTLGRAGAFTADTVSAGTGSLTVGAGQTDIGTVTAGLDVVVAGGSAVLGSVTAGRDYQVDVQDDLTLGKAGLRAQTAGGKVQLTSSAGSIVEGTSGLILTGNSDGLLGETVGLSATHIALGTSTINGGPARQSLVSVESTGATTLGTVNAATFAGNGRESFTATGAITATNVASFVSNGPVVLTSVTATSPQFGSVKINTPGAVTADSIVAGQSVEIGGIFDSPVGSVTANSVEATTGSVLVRAGASDLGSIKSGQDTRIVGNTANIGSVTAGGSYTVVATGNVTLGKAQGQRQQAAKGISVTSSGGTIGEGASGIVLTSDSDGSGGDALALTATTGAIALGTATLNGGPAKQSAVTLASGAATAIGSANGRSITATAKGFTANRELSSATDMTIASDGMLSLVQGANAVGAVSLSATDAAIGGAIDARTIAVTNSGSGNLVLGGTAASEAGKFVLSRAEVALLKATDTLTLGADGSDNVEIRQVDFSVPKTVQVLAHGKRIDITGRINFSGNSTLKLGGSTAANSIIRLQTGTGGTGGSIVSDGGVLELTAANIVGGTAAFANDLGAISGSGSAAEASRLNLAPGSSLYNNVGGTGEAMIDVGSMKVTFSNFAMFQNTSDASLSLLATGINLGNGNPQAIALDIASGATQPVFALFGSINGIVNAATALLGNPPLSHYDNIGASRINGCVIGGGNCQSVQNLTPSLTALDNIRTSIFTVKPDFQVPFDPLVGTNNDALFDDVGSFGLGELPMTPIECSEPTGNCEVQKKGGN